MRLTNSPFYEQLIKLTSPDRVFQDEPMSKHTSFKVGGPARYFVEVQSSDEIAALVTFLKKVDREYYVIGNGSNLLVGDKGYSGVILSVGKEMKEIVCEGDCVIAQAGAPLPAVAAFAMKEGLTGLEFASGIPGTMGGAMVMNAGAYGGEMRDVVTEVEAIMADGTLVTLRPEDLRFGYRTSVFKSTALICTKVVMQLAEGDPDQIRERVEELKKQRMEKQPLEYPSAGSTFKRPEGYFAGKLIQDAGLRGFSIGGAQVSEKHCGFVINKGNATAEDVHHLIAHVTDTVEEKFHVTLEPEVIFLGDRA